MRVVNILLLCMVVYASNAQIPRKLDGLEYHGTGKAEHQEGCEGCGNVGMVRFLSGSRLDYLLPGSDMMDRRTYMIKGERVLLEGGGMIIELRVDSLFLHDYDHVYPYIRISEAEE
ncbi:MAG: hypothetical protein KDC00_13385 [Flavobacteriales bacterium]|nr:hypothetical protein [Flavobacteriales bacterium]